MNVNKKFDRFKQWAGERMGGEIKTSVSDDFKALEIEMELRQQGTASPTTQNMIVCSLNPRPGQDAKVYERLR